MWWGWRRRSEWATRCCAEEPEALFKPGLAKAHDVLRIEQVAVGVAHTPLAMAAQWNVGARHGFHRVHRPFLGEGIEDAVGVELLGEAPYLAPLRVEHGLFVTHAALARNVRKCFGVVQHGDRIERRAQQQHLATQGHEARQRRTRAVAFVQRVVGDQLTRLRTDGRHVGVGMRAAQHARCLADEGVEQAKAAFGAGVARVERGPGVACRGIERGAVECLFVGRAVPRHVGHERATGGDAVAQRLHDAGGAAVYRAHRLERGVNHDHVLRAQTKASQVPNECADGQGRGHAGGASHDGGAAKGNRTPIWPLGGARSIH